MFASVTRHARVRVGREGVIARRDFLRGVSAAGLAAGALGWTDALAAKAPELQAKGMSCILLWMQGGPSQFETFDPKPDHENGGGTKAIPTAVGGARISENLPLVAKSFGDLALIRSATSKEGNHQRASFLLHTAHVPTASVHHPTMGAIVSREISHADCELPSFVRIGRRFNNSGNGGLLGAAYNPFSVADPRRLPDNAQPATDVRRFRRRLGLLSTLEKAAGDSEVQTDIADQKALYEKASKMVLSSQMKAFDISKESDKTKAAYGDSEFGSGCLLARRLIESGVTFVEVSLGNWDTHDSNFERCKQLCGELDRPYASLLADLKDRGMLERTLVIWMGEFGRTPRVSPRNGRDHFPQAFSVALAGAGVRGGQVIGSTNAGGTAIEDRPVSTADLFRSFYQALGIDSDRENMSAIGRPIKLVDGGTPVAELFS